MNTKRDFSGFKSYLGSYCIVCVWTVLCVSQWVSKVGLVGCWFYPGSASFNSLEKQIIPSHTNLYVNNIIELK